MSSADKGKGGGVRGGYQQPQGPSVEEKASEAIGKALDQWETEGKITTLPIRVGDVDKVIQEHAKANGNTLANNSMYFTGKGLSHSRRASKIRDGIAVSKEDFKKFPMNKSTMKIYYDKTTKNYTYTNGHNKFVLQTNVKVKLKNGKTSSSTLVTASKMRNDVEFAMSKYIRLK